MGAESLSLIPKELPKKSKRDILSDVLSRIPIEVYENFIKVLTENKDVELDTVVDLSAECRKSPLPLANRLSILEQKYPTFTQWKYVSGMSVEPNLQPVYAAYCHSIITKINADHVILLNNNRYQPHNFTLDQEIYLFVKSYSICISEDQKKLILSFQNRLIDRVKNHFGFVLSSDQITRLSSFLHDIKWTLLIDKTWSEIKVYVTDIKQKCERIADLMEMHQHLL